MATLFGYNTDNGKIEINFRGLLEKMTPEEKLQILEDLACDDVVIKHVADQIINGWTDNGSRGASLRNATADPDATANPLDHAWRRIAKASGDIAQKEITRLERALQYEKKLTAELFELWLACSPRKC